MSIPEYRPIYNEQGNPLFDCSEPGCRYSQTIGSLMSSGMCVCDQTFCEDHFDNHVCAVALQAIPNNLPPLGNIPRS